VKKQYKLLEVVALAEDLPKHKLVKGQVGTIVEILSDKEYEVEFCNDKGVSYALLPLQAEQLIRLHFNISKRKRIYA